MKEHLSENNLMIDFMPCINYAMSVNGKNYLNRLELTNDDDCDWRDLVVGISGDLFEPVERHVDIVPQGQSVIISGLDLKPDTDKLRTLTESTDTRFTVTVKQGENELLSLPQSVRLMAFDEWPGINKVPELAASFVTPNASELSQVRIDAAKHLERLTGSSSLDAYQTQDPNRVRAQVAAVYEAFRQQGIAYCSPPASFENNGQRIRLIGQLVQQKVGTCADLAMAFAACLESIGLNPLLCVSDGHMFVACWLVDSHYPQIICDDVSFLSKSIADGINEMVVVETTLLTEKGASFEQAVSAAERHILSTPDEFIMAIDIYRCRMDGIRPLPLTNADAQVNGLNLDQATDSVKEQQSYHITEEETRQLSRQQIWERKLLDFSLRNNLVNLRLGKKVIPFVSFNIEQLEDKLQAKTDIQILPLPTDKRIAPDDSGMYNSRVQGEALEKIVIDGVDHNQLYSYWTQEELTTALKGLFRISRTALEENGANTLFLCLGLLKWYETDKSIKPRYAPLLLEPVDIIKKSGNNYVLRMREEDLTFNTTLVEMLRQQYDVNITGVNPLPTDENGADVRKVFSIVRSTLKDHARWDVIEECLLGIFSFSKFVMWNDIHNNAEKMRQNPVIESLIQKRLVNLGMEQATDTRAIDSQIEPGSYAIPVDVDSSQMEAVIESGEGRSFILFGPPGTGKSQTITNMIANALYHNRRVLFVAEKMAALEVVQKRLAKVGLDPFCLEMHSNKANKSHLLHQLQTALDITRIKTPEEYADESRRLFEQRNALNKQINLLHQPQPSGMSLYDYITRYLAINTADSLEPTQQMTNGISPERITEYETLVKQLAPVLDLIGTPPTHPLFGLEVVDPSYEAQQKTTAMLQNASQLVPSAKSYIQALSDANGLSLPLSVKGLWLTERLATALANVAYINGDTLSIAQDPARLTPCRQIIATGKQRDAKAAEISSQYTPQMLSMNVATLKEDWTKATNKWFIPRYFAKRKVVKKLKGFRSDIKSDDMPGLITLLEEHQQLAASVAAQQGNLTAVFGPLATPGAQQWDQMEYSLQQAPVIQAILSEAGTPTAYIPPLDSQASQRLNPVALKQLCSLLNSATSYCSIDPRMSLDDVSTKILTWIQQINMSRDWAQWCLRKREMASKGLERVTTYIENGHDATEAHDAMLRGLYHRLSMAVIDGNQDLQMFNGMIFEDTIKKYRDMAKQFQELTKKALYCKLASRIPSLTVEAATGSEVGILKRYINSGGRGATIRHIIDQIPTLLPKLCPCMLMSPISVAQYIDLDQDKFDIVVFDEASQMPTSEAIGAIARGKALIVVGDPKQMPPTSFFTTTQVDESEADNDDMESILDDCITLSFPDHYLTWHYRSRHESLIAFSNSQYYDGKLYTFPSVDDRASKVTLVPVDGTYDMGRTRCNRTEAEAIVKEVLRRLADDKLCKQSIGIVSFSKVQQDLIEDILVDELAKNSQLERRAYDCEEPIFIKNLENVQGDERDVILFSVGYGPDKSGKVSMNFGPLNNQGGERRLNVAVSRARCEMMVFSTLQPEQIDLNRSQARGVEGLKRFLEFARSGRMPVAATQVTEQQSETQVIDSVAAELRAHGYQVDTQVGRSRFKVDLAVIDPDNSNGYIMGIMIDGKRYYNTLTERDREICQPGVLQGLGWNLQRVWTVDWFMNRERVLSRLISELEATKKAKNEPEKPIAKAQPLMSPQSSNTTKSAQSTAEPSDSKEQQLKAMESIPFAVKADEILIERTNDHGIPYMRCELSQTQKMPLSIGAFSVAKRQLQSAIMQIIQTEQPVTLATLCKRIPMLFPSGRMTPQIAEQIANIAIRVGWLDPQSPRDNPYYWENEKAAKGYDKYRISSEREDNEIPTIEFINATRLAITESMSAPIESIQKQVSNMLGYNRKRIGIYNGIQQAIEQLARNGIVQIIGDTVKIKEV